MNECFGASMTIGLLSVVCIILLAACILLIVRLCRKVIAEDEAAWIDQQRRGGAI